MIRFLGRRFLGVSIADQLDAKQQEMMDAQTKISDLQAQLNSLNADTTAPANTDSKSPAK